LFHAHGPAVAKERSAKLMTARVAVRRPSTADLRPALALAAADGLMRSTRCDGAALATRQKNVKSQAFGSGETLKKRKNINM